MSATISTQPSRRVPLATGLAVAGFLVAAGALGVAWEQSHDSPQSVETPAVRTATPQDYMNYDYYHGPQAFRLAQRQSVPVTGPNARSIERSQAFRQAQTTAPNARSIERYQGFSKPTAPSANSRSIERHQTFQAPPGGHVPPGE
jgi:hypothetical protein